MRLIYVHDPMCSWCWAFRPTLEALRARLPRGLGWENCLGGLAPDSDQPMPEATRTMVIGHWRRIAAELGTEFNFDFWKHCRPRRSTYPACRAVLAAAQQDREEAMILAIQKAYYLRAMNPSDDSTLRQLASELRLDCARFENALAAPTTQQELLRQVAKSRSWPVDGMPALLLEHKGRVHALPVDYRDETPTLRAIDMARQA